MQAFYTSWDGLIWLLLLLAPALLLQRGLHFELQAIFLILTRHENAAIGMFSLLFLPGVLLHELSHFLMARLLGVRTARFSILPSILPGGKLQLGFVETEQADLFRDALIGLAPLLSGGALVAYHGLVQLNLGSLGTVVGHNDWQGLWQALRQISVQPDFWVWFYLTFVIGSTMLPSDSDRRAWLPLSLWALLLVGLVAVAGAGPWLLENAAPALNTALRTLAVIFGINLGFHIVLWVPLRLLREGLARLAHVSLRTR